MESPLLTLDEAAKYLKMSRRNLDKRIAAGNLAKVRYSSNLVRVEKAECDRFIEASKVTALVGAES